MFESAFWRTEVWHPLTVHFPIALLLMGTLTTLISFFFKNENKRYLQISTVVLLIGGCLTAWVTIYTGDLADGIISRKICDPTILKDHENAAYTTTYLFSIATVIYVFMLTNLVKLQVRKYSFYFVFILMLAGSGYLIYVGHLGATLVYDQGAAVVNHVVDCPD